MTLGTKLGPYEILAPIGAGGMGEVWKARDTKLGRDIALKILPAAFASDPDRMARFEREARVLASLDHPNIAAIYGFEESDGVRALVLALIDGPTLAERIAAGPIPLDEAIQIARQIAEAVEYAHERGVIHRDLKPANIKLTSGGMVKVLDFGLAKALDDEPVPGAGTNSPTLTMGATRAGVLLGTAQYMSPEQAKCKQADRRSDIWSFGVVLYEMVTGKPPFSGETVGDILAAIIKDEPTLVAVPAEVRVLVVRCLDKDPRKRLQAIGEARIALENPTVEEVRPAGVEGNRPWGWIATGVFVLIAAGLAVGWWRATRPVDHSLMRLNVDLGPDAVATARVPVLISPNGTRLLFPVRSTDGKRRLATQLLDQSKVTPLAGTEEGSDPFFSPDGQWIGFFAGGKLKKMSVTGGAAVALCDAPFPLGASWAKDGNIIAALDGRSGLVRVPATGGEPQALTQLMPGEATHRWPQVLPSGDIVLYTSSSLVGSNEGADIQSFSLKTGERKTLWSGGYFGRYLPSDSGRGHLIFVHQGTVFGVPFDPVHMELHGTPVPVLGDVGVNPLTGTSQLDFSSNGTLVYLRANGAIANVGIRNWPIEWLDSSGRKQPLIKPGNYSTPRLSPDGQRLALAVLGETGYDIWTYDTKRDSMTRLTFARGENRWPVWTPDGKHIIYRSAGTINWIRADGAGEVQELLKGSAAITPYSVSPDGSRLAYQELSRKEGNDLWTVKLDLSDPEHPKPGKPESFLSTPFNEECPVFSPDGRWIAYYSNESGMYEVYVRPFPGPGGRWQISSGGGRFPVWSRNDHELFYETLDNRIWVADYSARNESFIAGKSRLWSEEQINDPGSVNADLAPDGKRFVVLGRAESTADKGNVHVTFLLNFYDELRRRVPVSK